MLPKKQRVKKQDFPRILKEGLVFYSTHLGLRIIKNTELSLPTVAIVVSAKTAKTSVERHLIKRQISSIIEGYISRLIPSQMVISVKTVFGKDDRLDIDKELLALLEKAKLLK